MTIADPTTTNYSATPRATAAAPAATTRDPRLDFFRGIAMFIILIAHTPGNWLTLWIPARWGFSDATEIFVFCSGMASAIAFGKTFERKGMALGTARVGFRVWQVYWAHIGLFFAVAATMAALNNTGLFDRDYVGQLNLYPFFNRPFEQLPALFTLTYVPNYFDILPMYMVILIMMPVMVGLSRVDLRLVALAVGLIWLAANTKTIVLLLGLSEDGWLMAQWWADINLPAEPWTQRGWFFNPFGWQLIFFTGFAFMIGWLPKPPVHWWLIGLALFVVLINIPLSSIGVRELGLRNADALFNAREWRIDNRPLISKSDFGLLRYVHFLALAYLAWVVVGPGGARIMPHGAGLIARAWAPLLAVIMKVGQQSLAVFVFSMFFARLMGMTFDVVGKSHWTMLWVNAVGFAAIILCAYGAGWFKTQPWRKKA
ncbi:membrane protein [Actibacterium mucosum KCTC 23349]|uniref:Membrane protein n=1 Tax=Actibacterium mucosum KCTC 23349 TaxID=1454373 RepID=A0A037ZIE5_9RHOB|nr:OpgC domain-containing protein [Actibacterium mucosum]KAJ56220.1 membrane protein [Actibacterium mucosum KCTC 23349]